MAHLQRGETWSGEFLVQSRQGRVFPAHVTDSPVLDERGQLIGIVGISTDITARKQAEDEARQKDTLIRIAGTADAHRRLGDRPARRARLLVR